MIFERMDFDFSSPRQGKLSLLFRGQVRLFRPKPRILELENSTIMRTTLVTLFIGHRARARARITARYLVGDDSQDSRSRDN